MLLRESRLIEPEPFIQPLEPTALSRNDPFMETSPAPLTLEDSSKKNPLFGEWLSFAAFIVELDGGEDPDTTSAAARWEKKPAINARATTSKSIRRRGFPFTVSQK
jgi:hypothetical protein